jgi:Fe-S cluster assembly ATP-binding protein
MLRINTLQVQGKQNAVLAEVNDFLMTPHTVSVLVGKNGSGKTSFLHGIFLHPSVRVTKRDIVCDTKDISHASVQELYMEGLFYVPQHSIALPGVSFMSFLHAAYEKKMGTTMPLLTFLTHVKKVCTEYGLPHALLEKNVHDGLSGGERKMQEMIQVCVLRPRYAFFDEIDAHLDRDARVRVAEILNTCVTEGMSVCVISHSFDFCELLSVTSVYHMTQGTIHKVGGATVLERFRTEGFEAE